MAAFIRQTPTYARLQLAIALLTGFISVVLVSLEQQRYLLNAGVGLWCAGFITLSSILLLVPAVQLHVGFTVLHLGLSLLSALAGVLVNALAFRKSVSIYDVPNEGNMSSILLGISLVLMGLEVVASLCLIVGFSLHRKLLKKQLSSLPKDEVEDGEAQKSLLKTNGIDK